MAAYDDTFNWVQFPEGRARFSGGVRGVDEQGHDTIAVEVGGDEYFGEVQRKFLSNNNDYNVEVISFGYREKTSLGMPMRGSCRIFTAAEVKIIETLIAKLISAGLHFIDRPYLLNEYPNASFMGKVIFRDGWVLVMNEEAAS